MSFLDQKVHSITAERSSLSLDYVIITEFDKSITKILYFEQLLTFLKQLF